MDSKRIIGGVVTFVALALAGEWIVRAADMFVGLFYSVGVIDWSALRNAVGLLVLPIGLYFLFRPAATTRTDRVTAAIQNVQFELAALTGDARRRIYSELASLYINLEKLKIPTPSLLVDGRETAYSQADTFLTGIGPLLRDGHLRDVRREAPLLIKSMGAKPSHMRTWWRPSTWRKPRA